MKLRCCHSEAVAKNIRMKHRCCHSEAVAEESRKEVDSSVASLLQNSGNRDFEGITNIRCHSEGDSPKSPENMDSSVTTFPQILWMTSCNLGLVTL